MPGPAELAQVHSSIPRVNSIVLNLQAHAAFAKYYDWQIALRVVVY